MSLLTITYKLLFIFEFILLYFIQRAFPYSGDLNETGVNEGEGTTINIPLEPGSGHTIVMETFDNIVGPALERFQPEFILVSAGTNL